MSIVVSSDSIRAEEFDEFVSHHGRVHQSFAYGEVLRQGLGQSIVRWVARRGSEIRAVASVAVLRSWLFGRRGVSLPVSDHSGICARDDEAFDALRQHLETWRRDQALASLELRQELRADPTRVPWPRLEHKVVSRLSLPATAEELWSSQSAKVRNLVRKGDKHGLVARSGGVEMLPRFYAVYRRNLRDLGMPCYPRSLFTALLTLEGTRIHVATRDEAPVAVGLTHDHGGVRHIPFAGSLRTERRASPSMFLYWHMLQSATAAGNTTFDFGRSTLDSGVHRFKRQWGAEDQPLVWYYCQDESAGLPRPRDDDLRFRVATALWRRLPVSMATFLGGRLTRSLP